MMLIVASTGILIYKTQCSCIGAEQGGIYLKPETCVDYFQVHYTLDVAENEKLGAENCSHECSAKNHVCGCDSQKIRFFKLAHDNTQYVAVSFERVPSLTIRDVFFVASLCFKVPIESVVTEKSFADPPPRIKSSKNFLIQVNQLKIPHSA